MYAAVGKPDSVHETTLVDPKHHFDVLVVMMTSCFAGKLVGWFESQKLNVAFHASAGD